MNDRSVITPVVLHCGRNLSLLAHAVCRGADLARTIAAMQFTGVQEISASRADVWQRLNDPDTLRQCIPGCERYEEVEPDTCEAVVVGFIGPVWVTLKGMVTVSDRMLDKGCRIEATGSGIAASFGKLVASVSLVDSARGTRLSYSAEAHVGDSLVLLGSHLIQMTASRFVEDFFARFNALLSSSA